MDKDSSRDIFSQAGAEKHSSSKSQWSDAEVGAMLERMKKMRDDIEVKLGEVYEKTGLNPKQVASYLSNPDNFTAGQLAVIKASREGVIEKYASFLGTAKPVPKKEQPFKDQSSKERKGKTLGARRNWISMQ